MDILTLFANLRAQLKEGILTDISDVVLTALAIDHDLTMWPKDLPPVFNYTSSYVEAVTEQVYGNYYHVYENLWVASVWNNYRTTQLMLHGLILECLAPYAPFAALAGLTQSPALQRQKSLQVVHTIGAEIAASVPFHLGFSNSSERSSFEKKSPAAGGLFSLWPLYILGVTDSVPEDLRAWAGGRLAVVGKLMGIQTALMLAWVLGMKQEMRMCSE